MCQRKQSLQIQCFFQLICKCIDLVLKKRDFFRLNQAQVPAAPGSILELGEISQCFYPGYFFHAFRENPIGRRGDPVKNDATNPTFFCVGEKSLDQRNHRPTHSSGIYDKNDGRFCDACKVIGRGGERTPPQTVIITHHAFHHAQVIPFRLFCEKGKRMLLIGKKRIQVTGRNPKNLFVEQGINKIRTAFKGMQPATVPG